MDVMVDCDDPFVVEGTIIKGENQPNEFRDAWAAILFLIQLIATVSVSVVFAPYAAFQRDEGASSSTNENDFSAQDDGFAQQQQDEDSSTSEGNSMILLLVISYAIAGATTMGMLSFMMSHAETLVKVSFFFAPVSFAIVAVLFLGAGTDISMYFALWAVFVSLLMVCCWFFYKKHIAFAAANLQSALTALRLNAATYGLAFLFSFVSFISTIVWFAAILGVYGKAASEGTVPCKDLYDDDEFQFAEGQLCDKNPPNSILIIFLLFGFYWTQQVVQNVLHVTTAGVVGAWWFTPLANPSCCSTTITSSLRRALTYSFGSICFGSLLVAFMQILEYLVRSSRRNGRGSIVLCIVECILQCLGRVLEYFNSWAFVYVGIYGYPYITAGKNVIQLFRQRGWTTLISDRLIFRVLLFCNLGVGAICGCFVMICEFLIGPFFPNMETQLVGAFFVAFLIGFLISNVALFCVESAVRTVIVCFAENPDVFDEHHPDLSETMQSGYAEAYPTVMGVLT